MAKVMAEVMAKVMAGVMAKVMAGVKIFRRTAARTDR